MAATRRELLAGLGAGLVAMQGGALAADGEAIAAARRRWATVGDIERLEREIRDVNQRVQNALARTRRTGFGPSALLFIDSVTTGTQIFTDPSGVNTFYNMPFPGSVIAISLAVPTVLSGTPGVDYWTGGVTKNLAGTAATLVMEAGEYHAEAVFEKGEVTLAPGDIFGFAVEVSGTPGTRSANALVWVSFT